MKLPEKTKALFNRVKTFAMATVSDSGMPNVVPMARKYWTEGDALIIGDMFMKATCRNVIDNGRVSLCAWDDDTGESYKLVGKGRYETRGDMPEGEDSAGIIVRQKSEIEIGSGGIRMPKITNATIVVALSTFVESDGVLIDSDPSGSAAEPQPLKSFQMSNTSIEVLGGVNGVRIVSRASFSARGQLSDLALVNVHVDGNFSAALRAVAEASELVGSIEHVKITNLTMSWEGGPMYGIALEPADSATINDVGIMNCKLAGHGPGSTAIFIGDGVTRTTIVGNSLYGSGTPIDDSGSLTEASSNQMT